mmetsp:Transcript_27660/g.54006  ORF Transcript_27660/g.54006 Transcript_27660/m.54006 type:complete len:261 (-) Transcript_27660:212-994(-)
MIYSFRPRVASHSVVSDEMFSSDGRHRSARPRPLPLRLLRRCRRRRHGRSGLDLLASRIIVARGATAFDRSRFVLFALPEDTQSLDGLLSGDAPPEGLSGKCCNGIAPKGPRRRARASRGPAKLRLALVLNLLGLDALLQVYKDELKVAELLLALCPRLRRHTRPLGGRRVVLKRNHLLEGFDAKLADGESLAEVVQEGLLVGLRVHRVRRGYGVVHLKQHTVVLAAHLLAALEARHVVADGLVKHLVAEVDVSQVGVGV